MLAAQPVHENVKLPVPLGGHLLAQRRLPCRELPCGLVQPPPGLLLGLVVELPPLLRQVSSPLLLGGRQGALGLLQRRIRLGALLRQRLLQLALRIIERPLGDVLLPPPLRKKIGSTLAPLLLQLGGKALEFLARLLSVKLALFFNGPLLLAVEPLPCLLDLSLRMFHQLLALLFQGVFVLILQTLPLLLALGQDPFDLRLQALDGHLLDLANLVLLPSLSAQFFGGNPVLLLPLQLLGGSVVRLLDLQLIFALHHLELFGKKLATLRQLRLIVEEAVNKLQIPLEPSFVLSLLRVQLVLPLLRGVEQCLLLVFPRLDQCTLQRIYGSALVLDLDLEQRQPGLERSGVVCEPVARRSTGQVLRHSARKGGLAVAVAMPTGRIVRRPG
mmetsp:Transcript_100722/g.291148  ORF Transcript_100722/g.291148 Transcript_100722/m.291148 type:complete len:387 (-) Transcript_100722:403-1563(-)